jgi:hypothetical protein
MRSLKRVNSFLSDFVDRLLRSDMCDPRIRTKQHEQIHKAHEIDMHFMNRTLLILVAVFSIGLSQAGCHKGEPGTTQTEPATSPKPQASPLVGFAKDLQYIKNGQYTYVWVFSRKDGKPLDKDDSQFLRTNAPQVVDWVITDEGKKVIGGTNFNLEEGNLALLKKRFVAEDYSGK